MNLCDTDRDVLLAALQPVIGIVERRPTLPVLRHLLLRCTGGRVEWTSSDLERQVSLAADLGGDAGDTTCTVPAFKLHEIVRALPAGQRVQLTAGRDRLTLRSGGSRFTLQTLPAADFPATPAPAADAVDLRLPCGLLAELIDRVAFAMAVQDIRYYFNGLLFRLDPGRLTLVGTDGNRLAVMHTPVAHEGPALALIVPRKTVIELQRLLRHARDDAQVLLQLSPGQLRCRLGALELVSTLIEGQYPDHRRVIPPANPLGLTLDRAAWLAAAQRVVILAHEKFRGLRLGLVPGGLRMVAGDAAQDEAMEELPAEYDGAGLEIGLNADYLIDLLGSTDAPTVHLALRDAHSPLLFTLPAQPGFACVVGPMRI